MPYFKRPSGQLYFLSDEDIDNGGRDLIPGDCVPITDEEGRQIESPPRTSEQLARIKRASRDQAISDTDWLVIRHRDEVESGAPTALTPDQYLALQAYRRLLRDLPANGSWPNVDLPVIPDFVAEL